MLNTRVPDNWSKMFSSSPFECDPPNQAQKGFSELRYRNKCEATAANWHAPLPTINSKYLQPYGARWLRSNSAEQRISPIRWGSSGVTFLATTDGEAVVPSARWKMRWGTWDVPTITGRSTPTQISWEQKTGWAYDLLGQWLESLWFPWREEQFQEDLKNS